MLTWFNAQPTWVKATIVVGVPVGGYLVYRAVKNRKKILIVIKKKTVRTGKPGRPKKTTKVAA